MKSLHWALGFRSVLLVWNPFKLYWYHGWGGQFLHSTYFFNGCRKGVTYWTSAHAINNSPWSHFRPAVCLGLKVRKLNWGSNPPGKLNPTQQQQTKYPQETPQQLPDHLSNHYPVFGTSNWRAFTGYIRITKCNQYACQQPCVTRAKQDGCY